MISAGHGITPTDVGIDSIKPTSEESVDGETDGGHSQKLRAHRKQIHNERIRVESRSAPGGKGRLALLREHVYGQAKPMEPTVGMFPGMTATAKSNDE